MPRRGRGRAAASITVKQNHAGGWVYALKYSTSMEGGALNQAAAAPSEHEALLAGIARLESTCDRIIRDARGNSGDAQVIQDWLRDLKSETQQPALFEVAA